MQKIIELWNPSGNLFRLTRALNERNRATHTYTLELCTYLEKSTRFVNIYAVLLFFCGVRCVQMKYRPKLHAKSDHTINFFFHFCCECLCVKRSIPSYHYEFALHFNMRFYGSLIQKEVLMLFDVLLLCSSFTILQIFCSSSFSGETLFFSFNEQIMNKK